MEESSSSPTRYSIAVPPFHEALPYEGQPAVVPRAVRYAAASGPGTILLRRLAFSVFEVGFNPETGPGLDLAVNFADIAA